MKTKEQVMEIFSQLYDKWEMEENDAYQKGLGYRGPNASLIRDYSFYDILNEVIVRINYGIY